MDIDILVKLLDLIGTVLVAWAALSVHHRFLKEHKVDNRVFRVMRFEQKLGLLGVCLIILAFLIDVLV